MVTLLSTQQCCAHPSTFHPCESNLKGGGYWVCFFQLRGISVVICPGYTQICDKTAMAEEHGKGELLTSWYLGRKEKGGAQFLVYLSRVSQ